MKKKLNTFQRMGRINWVAIGGALGIALGFYLEIVKDIETAISIIAGIALTIAVTQLGEIIHKDQIRDVLGTFYQVRQDRFLHDKLDVLIEYYLSIKSFNSDLFDERTREMVVAFLDEISLLANGQLKVEHHEEVVIGNKLAESCKKNIKASSFMDKVEWWDSPEGKAYVEKNVKLVKRGGKVLRVFILAKEQISDYEKILAYQSEKGVQVYIGIREEIPNHLIESYAIFDDECVRLESLTTGYEVSSMVFIDERTVRQYLRKFEEILLRSKKMTDVI